MVFKVHEEKGNPQYSVLVHLHIKSFGLLLNFIISFRFVAVTRTQHTVMPSSKVSSSLSPTSGLQGSGRKFGNPQYSLLVDLNLGQSFELVTLFYFVLQVCNTHMNTAHSNAFIK